jgi:dihydrolipoamide dehydrogenase
MISASDGFLSRGTATISLGEDKGFVKTVFDASIGELLGAHMIGSEDSGLRHCDELGDDGRGVDPHHHPHPTLSEMMHESVFDAHRRAIHK